jgi:ferredoxin
MCVFNVPDVFDQSEQDGTVVLLLPEPPPSLHDAARAAAAECPCRAITVHDGDATAP